MSFDDYDEGLNEAPKEVYLNTDEGSFYCEVCKDKVCNCDVPPWGKDVPVDETPVLNTKEQAFEKRKQELRDEQENKYEKPDKIYVEIDIPTKGKIGKECVIKLDKKVPFIEFALSQKLEWKKKDKFDRFATEELVATPFKLGNDKDTDKLKFKWEELDGRGKNVLKAGEYFIEVSARSKVAGEETTSKRIVVVE